MLSLKRMLLILRRSSERHGEQWGAEFFLGCAEVDDLLKSQNSMAK